MCRLKPYLARRSRRRAATRCRSPCGGAPTQPNQPAAKKQQRGRPFLAPRCPNTPPAVPLPRSSSPPAAAALTPTPARPLRPTRRPPSHAASLAASPRTMTPSSAACPRGSARTSALRLRAACPCRPPSACCRRCQRWAFKSHGACMHVHEQGCHVCPCRPPPACCRCCHRWVLACAWGSHACMGFACKHGDCMRVWGLHACVLQLQCAAALQAPHQGVQAAGMRPPPKQAPVSPPSPTLAYHRTRSRCARLRGGGCAAACSRAPLLRSSPRVRPSDLLSASRWQMLQFSTLATTPDGANVHAACDPAHTHANTTIHTHTHRLQRQALCV